MGQRTSGPDRAVRRQMVLRSRSDLTLTLKRENCRDWKAPHVEALDPGDGEPGPAHPPLDINQPAVDDVREMAVHPGIHALGNTVTRSVGIPRHGDDRETTAGPQ